MRINIIAALGARTRAIGKDNKLLWEIPPDLRRFKQLTLGGVAIMGRKTLESIVALTGKPLPDRFTIVITRNSSWNYRGCTVVHSLADALEAARKNGKEEVFVIGGGEIYKEALPIANRLYLTLVEDDSPGDTFFPPYEHLFRTTVSEESSLWRWTGLQFRWVTLDR